MSGIQFGRSLSLAFIQLGGLELGCSRDERQPHGDALVLVCGINRPEHLALLVVGLTRGSPDSNDTFVDDYVVRITDRLDGSGGLRGGEWVISPL